MKRPYVLTYVRPIVGQANQLGDCAVNAAMPYDGVVTHLNDGVDHPTEMVRREEPRVTYHLWGRLVLVTAVPVR
jgi:hypothetical protein